MNGKLEPFLELLVCRCSFQTLSDAVLQRRVGIPILISIIYQGYSRSLDQLFVETTLVVSKMIVLADIGVLLS